MQARYACRARLSSLRPDTPRKAVYLYASRSDGTAQRRAIEGETRIDAPAAIAAWGTLPPPKNDFKIRKPQKNRAERHKKWYSNAVLCFVDNNYGNERQTSTSVKI